MSILFRLVFRLFIALLLARLVLGLTGAVTPAGLLGFTLALVLFTYVFDFLDWYSAGRLRRALAAKDLGWRLARFLIGLNVVGKDMGGKKGERSQDSAPPPSVS